MALWASASDGDIAVIDYIYGGVGQILFRDVGDRLFMTGTGMFNSVVNGALRSWEGNKVVVFGIKIRPPR